MVFHEKDVNAQILRIFIDFSTKTNQYFITNLSQIIPDVIDNDECFGEAKKKVNVFESISILKRNYKLKNIDAAYLLILATRGYKFRVVMEKVYLCEEKAVFPNFEKFAPFKPKISESFDTKTAVLSNILKIQEKNDDELIQASIQSIPELLEKSFGVVYTGRVLSINEWLHLKEQDGEWISDETLRYKDYNIKTNIMANLLVLQARGWYLQEIPDKIKGKDYILIKKD
jgi:hypothetical protein